MNKAHSLVTQSNEGQRSLSGSPASVSAALREKKSERSSKAFVNYVKGSGTVHRTLCATIKTNGRSFLGNRMLVRYLIALLTK